MAELQQNLQAIKQQLQLQIERCVMNEKRQQKPTRDKLEAIVAQLIRQDRQQYRTLLRGLTLAYTPGHMTEDGRYRLVLSRLNKNPSKNEDEILRDCVLKLFPQVAKQRSVDVTVAAGQQTKTAIPRGFTVISWLAATQPRLI